MKTITLSFALAASLLALGCGETETKDPAKQLPTVETPPVPPPAAGPRTMGTARSMATRPDNLLYDPTFASLGTMYASGVYGDQATLAIDAPPTSPAGPATAVLLATPDPGGTASVILFGQGGSGAFTARVFIAVADGQKYPDVTILSTTSYDEVYGLDPVTGQDQIHGGKTYRLFQAQIPDTVLGQVVLLAQPSDDKPFALAAPELTSTTGLSTMGLVRPARRVTLNAAALRSVHAATSRPPVPMRPEVALARKMVKPR